jgi:hypothetical protein
MAQIDNREEWNNALREAGLEDAVGDRVIFPWGVKIAEVEGKKYLCALSPDEYRQIVKEATGKELSDDQVRRPDCVWTMGGCVSSGCNAVGGHCVDASSGGWHVCICNY